MSNNNSYFNAAFTGFVDGVNTNRKNTSTVGANYASIGAAGVVFATVLDALIPVDASISADRVNLLGSLCESYFEDLFMNSLVASAYNTAAASIAAQFNQLKTLLATPGLVVAAPFAQFFALMPGDNAATVAVGAAVEFPQDGPTSGAAVRASASTFTLPAVGTYRVTAQVSVDEPGQLQLAIGGVGLPNTVVGRATGTSQIVIDTLITTVVPASVLSVINPVGNAAALTITPIAGGTHSVSATLDIAQIA